MLHKADGDKNARTRGKKNFGGYHEGFNFNRHDDLASIYEKKLEKGKEVDMTR